MASQSERERRKALRRAAEDAQRREAEARIPIARSDLSALFNYLDGALEQGCDHSLRFTREFLERRSLDEAATVPWLNSYGGFCDCEVLANGEDAWPSGSLR
jgi:hypothetical protein